MLKVINVGEIRKALRRFDDDEKVSVFLSILNEDSEYLFGKSFDVDRWQRNGLSLELIISVKNSVLKEDSEYANDLLEEKEKRKKEDRRKEKSRTNKLYKAAKRPEMMIISFDEACNRLKNNDYFFMIFNGLDDESDTYASILNQHPWIAREFVTPDETSRHLLLIEKNSESKDYLIHLPRELNNRIIIDIEKWDELIAVAFNPDKALLERTVEDNNRIDMAKSFQEHPRDLLRSLESKKNEIH